MKRRLLGILTAAALMAPSPAYAVDLNAKVPGFLGIQIGLCGHNDNWPVPTSGAYWIPCWWI